MAKHTNNTAILRLFWDVSRPYAWRRNLAVIIATLNHAVGMFIIPLIIASFLDLVQNGGLQGDQVWRLIGAYTFAPLWSEIIGWRILIFLVWM